MTNAYRSAQRRLPCRVLASVAGSLLLALLPPLVSHAQTVPPAPPIAVLVRLQDGAPVAGIQITLRPAAPDLGGPPSPLPTRQATTDAQGHADFPPLDGWIWYLTLHGAVAGRPLEDPASQGQPPWGTNPAGGGFPILADPAFENAAALPTPVAGNPPVLVPILLVDRQDLWIAALDLGSATSRPLSLPAAAAQLSPAPMVIRVVPSIVTSPPAIGPTVLLVSLPVLGGLLIGGVLAVHRRRHPHQPRPAAYLRSAPPARTAQKETHPHA